MKYECAFCGADIFLPHGWWALWTALGNSLSAHDAQYCPESRNHSHQPEEI